LANLLTLKRRFFFEEKGDRMEENRLHTAEAIGCNHKNERTYTQRCFDILNGFELLYTKCENCHKTLTLDIKKLAQH
jgi:hypothetical protein